MLGAHPEWWSPHGFLYTYDPGATIYGLNSTRDAEDLYEIMAALRREPALSRFSSDQLPNFPWDEVEKHFDALYHVGYSSDSYDFTYGWDAEKHCMDESKCSNIGCACQDR